MKLNKLLLSTMLFALCLGQTALARVTYELGESSDTITVTSDIGVNDELLYLMTPGVRIADYEAALQTDSVEAITAYFEQINDKTVPFTREIKMKSTDLPGEYMLFLGNDTAVSVWYASAGYRLETCKKIGAVDDDYTQLMKDNIYYFCKNPERLGTGTEIDKIIDAVKGKLTPGTLADDVESCKLLEKYIEESLLYVKASNGEKFTRAELENILQTSFPQEIGALIGSMSDEGIEVTINVIAAKRPQSYEEFKKGVASQLVLGAIGYPKSFDASQMADFIIKHKSYIGLNTDSFETFSLTKQANIAKKISDAKPMNAETIEKIIKDSAEKPQTTGGSNTAGGGGGGGGVSTVKPAPVVTPPEQPDQPEKEEDTEKAVFADLGGYVWAEEAISYMSEKGYVKGVSEKEFSPAKQITRAEFVAIMTRCMGYTAEENEGNIFADVSNDFWGYSSIMAAYKNGIISGTGERTFNPNGNISRQDMAVILNNIYKNTENTAEMRTSFEDWDEISEYAREAVGTLYGAGILNGADNKYNPKGLCTRAEAVQAIYGFLKAIDKE